MPSNKMINNTDIPVYIKRHRSSTFAIIMILVNLLVQSKIYANYYRYTGSAHQRGYFRI